MLPIFSDISAFRRDTLGFLSEKTTTAKMPLVKLNLGLRPVYLLSDPTLVKPFLKLDEAESDKGRLVHELKEVIGENSLTLSGEAHRIRRQAIHGQLVKGLSATYIPEIHATVREFAINATQAGTFDAHKLTAPLALRVITDIIFGRETLSSADQAILLNAITATEKDVFDKSFRIIPSSPWAKARKRKHLASARKAMMTVVDRARKKATNQSLLKSLEEIGLTSLELLDEVLLIVLAGHHTTGSAAAFMLYHLANSPKVCDKLTAEYSTLETDDGSLSARKLTEPAAMSRAVASEVLRLYPSAYWLSREIKVPTTFAGTALKPGTSVIVSPWALQRHPGYFEQPDEFNIERNFTSPAFIPFGVGPRACVGLNLAMRELQMIALEFANSMTFEHVQAPQGDHPVASLTLVPPPIKLTVRSNQAMMHIITAQDAA